MTADRTNLDFGIAKLLAGGAGSRVAPPPRAADDDTRIPVGQVKGEAVTTASDVYSLRSSYLS